VLAPAHFDRKRLSEYPHFDGLDHLKNHDAAKSCVFLSSEVKKNCACASFADREWKKYKPIGLESKGNK